MSAPCRQCESVAVAEIAYAWGRRSYCHAHLRWVRTLNRAGAVRWLTTRVDLGYVVGHSVEVSPEDLWPTLPLDMLSGDVPVNVEMHGRSFVVHPEFIDPEGL